MPGAVGFRSRHARSAAHGPHVYGATRASHDVSPTPTSAAGRSGQRVHASQTEAHSAGGVAWQLEMRGYVAPPQPVSPARR
jgi:hypothetical protein